MNQISNYAIQRTLGNGGMATVFLGEHTLLHNQSAIKVLNPELVRNENIRKRFLAEARSMARMNHPNVIKVNDLIEEGETVAFVMEYIEGETLKEFMDRKGKCTDDEVRSIFHQMLDALSYVHAQQLVHRDIKPSNFMIDGQGRVKLMDFGIAKTLDESSAEYTQTGTGAQMGTPMYMSPEQVKSTKSVTAQSDIYSLGVVLWQMVTGQRPYDSSTMSTFEIHTKIVTEKLAHTYTHWDNIIQKATEKEPQDRFVDVRNFKTALDGSFDFGEATIVQQKSTTQAKKSTPKKTTRSTNLDSESTQLLTETVQAKQDAVIYDYYREPFDFSVLSAEQRNYSKKHTCTSFSVAGGIILHYITFGIFTFFNLGLKHGYFPKLNKDDFGSGAAIGYMFIPFYSIYWFFVFHNRLAKKISYQYRVRGLSSPVSQGFATAVCIISLIPCINLLSFFILHPIFYGLVQSAINNLAKSESLK